MHQILKREEKGKRRVVRGERRGVAGVVWGREVGRPPPCR